MTIPFHPDWNYCNIALKDKFSLSISTDQKDSFHESFGECRDAEDDTDDDRMREIINNYEKMKKRRGPRGKYVLKN